MANVDDLARLLAAQSKTVAVAEACTNGLLGYTLGSVPGASRYFPGGVIAYTYGAKNRLLGISQETLQQAGAVSPAIALEMARRVRQLLNTDLGVSTTGISGPTGGTPAKPVGLFYIALSAQNGEEECIERRFESDRDGNNRLAVEAAMELLKVYLQRPE